MNKEKFYKTKIDLLEMNNKLSNEIISILKERIKIKENTIEIYEDILRKRGLL